MRKTLILAAALAFGASTVAGAQGMTALNVGDPAPPMNVLKWVKGDAVKEFKSGKVYVVEFWATWCGPCKTSIPHLTELAHKYKDQVAFTGVSVWENQDPKDETYVPKVENFVKEWGEKMDYNVAVDSPDGIMAKTWLQAAGQNGIPSAFVIGKDGKIAWIGHPMDRLEEVLAGVVAGTFNPEAEAAASGPSDAEMQSLLEPIGEALASNDTAKALVEIDKVLKAHPEMEMNLATTKLDILIKADEAKGHEYANSLFEGILKDNAMGLNSVAWTIVDDATGLKNPDLDLAIKVAERANELSDEKNAYIIDTLAYALFKKGDVKRAISLQTKAVDIAKKEADFDEATLKEMTERLAEFKKKAG